MIIVIIGMIITMMIVIIVITIAIIIMMIKIMLIIAVVTMIINSTSLSSDFYQWSTGSTTARFIKNQEASRLELH